MLKKCPSVFREAGSQETMWRPLLKPYVDGVHGGWCWIRAGAVSLQSQPNSSQFKFQLGYFLVVKELWREGGTLTWLMFFLLLHCGWFSDLGMKITGVGSRNNRFIQLSGSKWLVQLCTRTGSARSQGPQLFCINLKGKEGKQEWIPDVIYNN